MARDHGEAYDAFVATLTRAIGSNFPGDYWLILAHCSQCQAALTSTGSMGYVPPNSVPKLTPEMSLEWHLLHEARGRSFPCPACKAPNGEASANEAYAARVAFCTGTAFVSRTPLPLPDPVRSACYVFAPPGTWTDLGVDPHPNDVIKHYGRMVHPVISAVSLLNTVRPEMQVVSVDVCPEEIVTGLYPGMEGDRLMTLLGGLASMDGRPGPHVFCLVRPGRVDPSFEEAGLGELYQGLAKRMGIGVAYVSSLPLMARRTVAIGARLGVEVQVDPKSWAVRLRKGGRALDVSLSNVGLMGPGGGLTFDEAIYEIGFLRTMAGGR